MRKIFLALCLSSLAAAETRLDQLLGRQRLIYSSAVVTSGFYDARGVSRYRSQPGLHAGYDIAMPAGSNVPIAWPGSVRRIVPWADGEWGVEILHQDGTTATYGHIFPCVEVGQALETGQVVGTIARDHLDVKMRDAQGNLFDYGSNSFSARSLPALPSPPDPAALAFQQQLRRLPEREALSGQSWKILQENGLRLASPITPVVELGKLERLRASLSSQRLGRLTWTDEDRKRADDFQITAMSMARRYELGLISRKQCQAAQRRAQLWKLVAKPPKEASKAHVSPSLQPQ